MGLGFCCFAVAVGTAAFSVFEGYPAEAALRVAVYSITTVGLGQTAPDSVASKIFFIFYVLIGSNLLAVGAGPGGGLPPPAGEARPPDLTTGL